MHHVIGGCLTDLERKLLQFLVEKPLLWQQPRDFLAFELGVGLSTLSRILRTCRDKGIDLSNRRDIIEALYLDLLEKQEVEKRLQAKFNACKAYFKRHTISKWNEFTRREKDVLICFSDMEKVKLSDCQLAAELGVSRKTLQKYIENIYRKLKINNRASLAIVATHFMLERGVTTWNPSS